MNTKIQNNFNKKGFCIYENLISKDVCKGLIDKLISIETYPQFEKLKPRMHFNRTTNGLINSIHRIDEWGKDIFPEILTDTNTKQIASTLMGCDAELFSAQAFMKPAHDGLATPIHQDNWYWCYPEYGGITMWISLSGASEANGGLSYHYKNTKVTTMLEHTPSDNTPGSSWILASEDFDESFWDTPILTPGDAVIHDGLVIHRSFANNSSQPRIGFLLNYKPINFTRNEDAFEKQQARLKDLSNAS